MASQRKRQWGHACHHCGKRWELDSLMTRFWDSRSQIQRSIPRMNLLSLTHLEQTLTRVLFTVQASHRRGSSSWIRQTTISATVWPLCRAPCPSPVMWRGTRRMAARFCATPGRPLAGNVLVSESMEERSFIFAPRRAMPADLYGLHVTVDGVPTTVCNGNHFHSYCRFNVSSPSISAICSLKMRGSFLFLPDCDPFSSDCLLPDTYHLHFESNHWPPGYGRSSPLNSFVLISLESTVKSVSDTLQALCSQFMGRSSATCTEATPGWALMGVKSDFWGILLHHSTDLFVSCSLLLLTLYDPRSLNLSCSDF